MTLSYSLDEEEIEWDKTVATIDSSGDSACGGCLSRLKVIGRSCSSSGSHHKQSKEILEIHGGGWTEEG